MSEAATPDVSVEEAEEVNVTQVVETPAEGSETETDGGDSSDEDS